MNSIHINPLPLDLLGPLEQRPFKGRIIGVGSTTGTIGTLGTTS
jgi:hypothetical protein